ncbi:hypothetical protein Acr_23g0003750 [Actinidia rufa]|uniref:Uncharacterized protein n=1 Tax=Actinidia rufa TaxID=165716 RepID=A0A7J0GMH8_9ERIC|nr:hypothetical protein Acr_23g0003750 [Actinidia rufa]
MGCMVEWRELLRRWMIFIESVVEEHERGERKGGHEDFVDVLLQVQRENVASGSPIHRESVKALILDMFVAGIDTTASLIEWAMAELLGHPLILKKLQSEVREIAEAKQAITEDMLEKNALPKSRDQRDPPPPPARPSPYSPGCPGIQFAMSVDELALANLVGNFDFSLPVGEELDMSEAPGLTVRKRTALLAVVTPW